MTLYCKEWTKSNPHDFSPVPAEMWHLYSVEDNLVALVQVRHHSKILILFNKLLYGKQNCSYYLFRQPNDPPGIPVWTNRAETLEEAKRQVLQDLNAKIISPKMMSFL